MFGLKSLTVSTIRYEPKTLFTKASSAALFVGLWLPIIVVATFYIFPDFTEIRDFGLLQFSGILPYPLAGLSVGPLFFQQFMSYICLTPIALAILFKVSKLPLFPLLMIVDLAIGWSDTNELLAIAVPTIPQFRQIAVLVFLIVLVFYILGLLGSIVLMIDFFSFQKHRNFIQKMLPDGKTFADLHAAALEKLRNERTNSESTSTAGKPVVL